MYVRVKNGRHYLVEKVKTPDGRRRQRVVAYLGAHATLPEAIDGLAAELEVQRSLATAMAKKARAARRRYPDGWLRDGEFPPAGYVSYVAPRAAEILREHWDAERPPTKPGAEPTGSSPV